MKNKQALTIDLRRIVTNFPSYVVRILEDFIHTTNFIAFLTPICLKHTSFESNHLNEQFVESGIDSELNFDQRVMRDIGSAL